MTTNQPAKTGYVDGMLRYTPLPVLKGPGRGLHVKVGRSIFRVTGRGEPPLEALLTELVGPGDVFYDIGANIGWYSLLAARQGATVVAFEPDQQNAWLVRENLAANGLAGTVVPAALTDRDGWLPFQQNGSLMGRLTKTDSKAQAEQRAKHPRAGDTVLVPASTLDGWLEQTGAAPPTVVKIDVEGAEIGVLRGATRAIQQHRPRLVVELHGTREEACDELDRLGYQHRPVEVECESRQAPWWAHLLAEPA